MGRPVSLADSLTGPTGRDPLGGRAPGKVKERGISSSTSCMECDKLTYYPFSRFTEEEVELLPRTDNSGACV